MMKHQDRPDPAKEGPKQVMSPAEISRIQPSARDCLVHVTKDRLILDARTCPSLLTCHKSHRTDRSRPRTYFLFTKDSHVARHTRAPDHHWPMTRAKNIGIPVRYRRHRRRGSLDKRKAHSSRADRIHAGARGIPPARKSNNAPTPSPNRQPVAGKLSINQSSCRGFPIATRRTSAPDVLMHSTISAVSPCGKYP